MNPLCSLVGVLDGCNVIELPGVDGSSPSPGWAVEFPRREGPASAALIVLSGEVQDTVHEHERTTETYICLSGEGMLLKGKKVSPFRPGDSMVIEPGMAHAVAPKAGQPVTMLVVSTPPFDPEDFIPHDGERVI